MSNAIIIIPTYEERENIRDVIEAVFALPKDFHILVVDDNSPDGTSKIVEELQEHFNTTEVKLHLLTRPKKLGLGTAYIDGFNFALDRNYEFILQMDADFSHNPKDLVNLYLYCSEKGFDVSIGSRYATGVNVVNWSMRRVLLSYFASRYVRLITGIPIHDTTAGFTCFRRKVLEVIPLDQVKFVGYAFQIEMKFIAWKYGFTVTELPIIFTERIRGESKMSAGIFQEAFFGVLKMKIESWFKKYIPAG